MTNWRGRTAFITGGASGIGLGIAKALAAHGINVVIADLRCDHLDRALREFQDKGLARSVRAIHLDVTDRAAMARAAEETHAIFGNVHILVNNAGVGLHGPFDGITYDDWDFGLAVNLGGVINGLQTFLPRLRAQGEGGHIVNTASLAALVSMPASYVVYQVAKAAVVTLSEAIRDDLAKDAIGISVLCPGPVRTNIHQVTKNRPARFGVSDAFFAEENSPAARVQFPSMLEPEAVGELVLRAIQDNVLHVITHGEWRTAVESRHAALIAAMPKNLDLALMAMLQGK